MNTPGETAATLEGLARAAGIRIDELRAQGVESPEYHVDSSISENIPLGEIGGLADVFRDRERIARERGEMGEDESGVSNAYRVRLDTGKTLIRFAQGRMTFNELMEEHYETLISQSFREGRDMEWWTENLRETQTVLRDMGVLDKDFIKADGELSRLDVLEGASYLSRSVAMFEAQKKRGALPAGVRDFLRMLAAWMQSAMGLARLGYGFNVAAEKGHINKDFEGEIYAILGIRNAQLNDIAQASERQTIERANKAGMDMSASFTRDNSLQDNENEREQGSNDDAAGTGEFTERTIRRRIGGAGSRADDGGIGRNDSSDIEGSPARVRERGGYDDGAENNGAEGLELSESHDSAVGVLGVKSFTPSSTRQDLAEKHRLYGGEIIELESSPQAAAYFRECLETGKASQNPFGECVYTYEVEEYEHMRLFVLPNGSSGGNPVEVRVLSCVPNITHFKLIA